MNFYKLWKLTEDKSSGRVLVISDLPDLGNKLELVLNPYRITVDQVYNAKDGLAKANDYDVVVLSVPDNIGIQHTGDFTVGIFEDLVKVNQKLLFAISFGYDPAHTLVKAAQLGYKNCYFYYRNNNIGQEGIIEKFAKYFPEIREKNFSGS